MTPWSEANFDPETLFGRPIRNGFLLNVLALPLSNIIEEDFYTYKEIHDQMGRANFNPRSFILFDQSL
jgi:hypothetical protein